jgi:hypothetical protein
MAMVRARIVLDQPTAERLRAASEQSHASMSEIVRQALIFYFENREPDVSWIGSLKPKHRVSHDHDSIRNSVVAGRKRGKR